MRKRDRDRGKASHRRLASLACAAVALLAAPSAARAADFTVDTLADTAGNCNATPSSCSLRQAVNSVNGVPGANHRILFSPGLAGTIMLGSPLPALDVPVFTRQILGPGASTLAVSGAGSHRIFEVASTSGPVTISGLTLRDANVAPESGGAVLNDNAKLILRSAVVTGNKANSGGGIAVTGAGAETTIEASTISGNTARGGGGVASTAGATTTIRRSTISGNSVPGTGGGLLIGVGGATAIESSTITANAADTGGGIQKAAGEVASLTNTIVAGNLAPFGPDLANDPDDRFDVSFALIGNTSGALFFILGGSIFNVPAQLGPLQGNGGPTPTHAPALTSPAIDAGFAAGPDQRGFPRPVLQPTIPLAAGSNGADIGAVELAAAAVPSIAQPSNDFRFGKLKRKTRKGIAILTVHLPGPGEIGLRGKGIKRIGLARAGARASRFVDGSRVKLRIKPKKKGKAGKRLRKRLREKGKAKSKVRVTYLPTGGAANTRSRQVKLVRKRR